MIERYITRKIIEGRWTFWHVIDSWSGESVKVFDAYNYQAPATQAKKYTAKKNGLDGDPLNAATE